MSSCWSHDCCATHGTCCCATATRVAGFLWVLQLLLDHPWSVRPLVVDPASEVPPEDRRAVVQVRSVPSTGLIFPLLTC